MNDFTKEELVYMKDGLALILNKCGMSTDLCDKLFILIDKIQSMIDNYCEHTPSDAHYEQFRWQLCRKCGVQYK